MPNKMERFTQRARRVLSLAQEEAERFQHKSIDTPHLLLGLLREEEGVASQALRNLGVQRQQIEKVIAEQGQSSPLPPGTSPDLSLETKRTLELAVDEARTMGHNFIGTEHVLLGLLRLPDSAAVKIFSLLDIVPETVRREIRQLLQEVSTHPRPAAESSAPTAGLTMPPSEERLRILEMVKDGTITADDATKLLQALQPIPPFSWDDYLNLLRLMSQAQAGKERALRLKITDPTAQTVIVEMKIPLKQVHDGIFSLLRAIAEGTTGPIPIDSDDETHHIELFLDEE